MGHPALRLQDPLDPESVYLLEALLERCVSARRGGGAYAWATAQGVRLLLRDSVFERFVTHNEFDLIVGVDAVTDTAALQALSSAQEDLDGLSIRIFASEAQEAMFHPKAAWFREQGGGALVVGSGNLTNGGLRGNWEAFTVSRLTVAEAEEIHQHWEAWLGRHAASLRPLDDPLVVERAERNRAWAAARRDRARRAPEAADEEAPLVMVEGSVLIAEIPRAGNRWKQANFNRETYEGFFGARVGTQRRILLQHVSPDGVLGTVESRPSVEVQSQNYRFELDAPADVEYPAGGRPIGVFLRVRPGTFVYRLTVPGDADYGAVSAFLDREWHGRQDRMRRVPTTMAVAAPQLAGSPIWTAASKAFRDEE